jgi:hypothetical protein
MSLNFAYTLWDTCKKRQYANFKEFVQMYISCTLDLLRFFDISHVWHIPTLSTKFFRLYAIKTNKFKNHDLNKQFLPFSRTLFYPYCQLFIWQKWPEKNWNHYRKLLLSSAFFHSIYKLLKMCLWPIIQLYNDSWCKLVFHTNRNRKKILCI